MKALVRANSMKALVILSGGQDSTICLHWALQQFDEVEAITFDYGQRHSVEIAAATKVASLAGVKHEIVYVGNGLLVSKSPLTSENPLEEYSEFKEMDGIIGNRRELTFVAMRNALFLTIAANRAEANGFAVLVTGVCEMDTANYDDCRKVFIDATEKYINTALGHDHRGTQKISIATPLLTMTKAESIHFAKSIPNAFEALAYSHTCYAGKVPPCGKCHSCVLRAEGFKDAGIIDPLIERTA